MTLRVSLTRGFWKSYCTGISRSIGLELIENSLSRKQSVGKGLCASLRTRHLCGGPFFGRNCTTEDSTHLVLGSYRSGLRSWGRFLRAFGSPDFPINPNSLV